MSHLLSQETIRQVAEAVRIEEIVGADLPLRKNGTVLVGPCPFHQERTPSFVVTPARQRFKCFGCGAGGDVFGYVTLTRQASFPEAVRLLAARVGIPVTGDGERHENPVQNLAAKPPARGIPDKQTSRTLRAVRWINDLYLGSQAELLAVAESRGLSLAGVALAAERGLLNFGSPRGRHSWIVRDAEGTNAQARRLDGSRWEHIGGKKAWTLPGSRAAWPIGTREAGAYPVVVVVEGAPDLLAAHHFIAAEGREDDVAVIAILGAANNISEDALLLLANKRVRLFPHTDAAGLAAAVRWTTALERVGCEVDAFLFEGLRRTDGATVADLNDLALLDADCFEAERGELTEVLPQ